jgi:hypothetical protein
MAETARIEQRVGASKFAAPLQPPPIPSGWQIGAARIRSSHERRASRLQPASDGPMDGEPRTATSQKATARTAADARPASARLSVVLGVVREMPPSRADGFRSVDHPLGR